MRGTVSPRGTFLCGLLAAAMGVFILLMGLGVVPVDPRTVHAPMWIASAAAALASIGSWVVFGPGSRTCSGTGMFLLSREAGETVGRIVFGFGALLTWLITLALAVSGARKLFFDRSR